VLCWALGYVPEEASWPTLHFYFTQRRHFVSAEFTLQNVIVFVERFYLLIIRNVIELFVPKTNLSCCYFGNVKLYCLVNEGRMAMLTREL